MSHEQSETVERPGGGWINIYGRNTPKAGRQLPGTPVYATKEAAVEAAQQRSAEHDKPARPTALLPADSVPVSFLKGGLLSGLEGALNPDRRREAQQSITMYREMDEAHQQKVLASAVGGRVLKATILQIYNEWRARKPAPPITGVRASLRDTTESDIA